MFSVNEVAKQLQITPQAIYKQRDFLLDNGYMIKDKFGQWQISSQGFNYLKDKRINKLNQGTLEVKQVGAENSNEQRANNEGTSLFELKEVYKTQVELLQRQIEELKEDRNYFKFLYEEKDKQLNQYINTHLLTSGTDEQAAAEPKGFFRRFFSK